MIRLPSIIGEKIKPKVKTRAKSMYLKNTKNQLSLPLFLPVIQEYEQIDQYIVMKRLGNGQFGTTYVVKEGKYYTSTQQQYDGYSVYNNNLIDTILHPTNTVRVLKRIICHSDRLKLHNARKESRILAHIPQSQYVLTVYDFFQWKGDYCIVTNYCTGGTLFDHIQSQTNPYSTKTISRILHDCLQGLCVLHSHRPSIVHRDIKPDNIFMNENGQFVLGDMGLSRLVNEDTLAYTTNIGYIAYRSPSMIKNGKYSTRSDIWSIGCILLCLLTLSPLFLEEYFHNKKETLGQSIYEHTCTDVRSILSEYTYNNDWILTILKMCLFQSKVTVNELLKIVVLQQLI
jgi:serine/threonine protein kinase